MKKSDPMPGLNVPASKVPPGETFVFDGVDCMRVSAPAGKKLAAVLTKKADRVFALSLGSGHLMVLRPTEVVELFEMVYFVRRPVEAPDA
jgi:hypothetical protein